MLPYPQIDPVALAIGPLKIHWYGLMYLVGIGGAWLLASRRMNRFDPTWTKEKLSDLIFWLAMGVIVGGRLGYVLFYDLSAYIANPLLPAHSLGFIYLPALLGIALTSMIFARFGARLAHKVSPRLLKRMFAALLLCVGISFLVQ